MVEEQVSRLMRNAPPYGYQFGRGRTAFSREELVAKRRNATLPERRAFDSCAVVGSSGSLLHARHGKEIDEHQAVFRVNSAPTARYEQHTGRRTTWRVVASPHAASDYRFHEQAQYPDETMIVVCDRPYVYSCQHVLFKSAKRRMHALNPIFYAHVRKQTSLRRDQSRTIPLTGVVAVAVAMRVCRTVDVYGLSTVAASKDNDAGGSRKKPARGRTHDGAKPTCFYYFRCGGSTDDWYHRRPGDAEFHDFGGNAAALLRWNASGQVRLLVR